MCVIAWNWQPRSATPLVLLSNRDEFHARPVQALHWWDTHDQDVGLLAGRDLQAGGTWLGVNRHGRLAAITNYRSTNVTRRDAPSRGELVAQFLQETQTAQEYLEALSERADTYNPFNLLVFDGHHLMGLESRQARILLFSPGIGGVSNADFNTPWPKLVRLQSGLFQKIQSGTMDIDSLLKLLHDSTLEHDGALPHTGVPLDVERSLSSIFVTMPGYGTRACSVVHLHQDRVDFAEQTVGEQGFQGTVAFSFSPRAI